MALRATGALAAAGLVTTIRLVARRPVLYGGTAAFVVLSSVVGANALRQDPLAVNPIMATRTHVTSTVLSASAPVQAAPAPAVVEPWTPVNDPRIMSVPLVREVQQVLKTHGFYLGEIDGRPGQATDLAVRAFQEKQGLQIDGVITPLLLAQVRQYGAVNPTPGGDDRSLEERVAELNAQQADRELVRQIQAGLANARVAELKADGIMGAQTRAAIRTFQTQQGLAVTGEAEPEVLKKLTELGAVR
ncbi:peptidoglycan-binding domain-containing protein [Aureimonas frigidaquae]|uniref:peptidoglycan-binding domain-containing protein n=1 Tax=Aureimonas frigidaquae TaxID=424757 RepID=UPI00078425A0|nr:peptidoglycan-binding protein [Aureimonas frigidaquae]